MIYKFEEVFTELENGDLLLTFPEEFGTMFNDGDEVTLRVEGKTLVIEKHAAKED